MILKVICHLNARFVEADAPANLRFEKNGVVVKVDMAFPDPKAFAIVTLAGSADVNESESSSSLASDLVSSEGHRLVKDFPFLIPPEVPSGYDAGLSSAYEDIGRVLQQVGSLTRWRFMLSGLDAVFKDEEVVIEADGHVWPLNGFASAAMGDDKARIVASDLSEVIRLTALDTAEPLPHQLWREAWNLRNTNPRSALVIGVAAAEVGFKQLIATLVPHTQWLVEELPSPPLAPMMKNYLPQLPIKAAIEPKRRSPAHLRKVLGSAVEHRNDVVHRGLAEVGDLRQVLYAVRDFLYLLDFYRGEQWALANLSQETQTALGIKPPDRDS
jgi:hypothetical protein